MDNKVFTLKEISQWTKEGANVLIPAIQRGLVWKPRQVELLWDSILRGFPIGSFMLSDTKDNPNQYHLIDGQQRFNAISLGYNVDTNPRAVLWIDIAPSFHSSSSRSSYELLRLHILGDMARMINVHLSIPMIVVMPCLYITYKEVFITKTFL